MNETNLRKADPPAVAPAAPTGAAARRRGLALGAAVGAALLVAGAGGYLLGRHREPATETAVVRSSEATAERPPPSREVQTAKRLLSDWKPAAADPLRPPAETDGRFEPALHLSPPFDAVDATLIDSLDTRLRLAHARPVGRNEVCVDRAGLRFACGLKGRASLQNHIYDKTVRCLRLFLDTDAPVSAGTAGHPIVDVRCTVDGEDLATHQIRAGYAFPTDLADADQRAALDDARRRGAGVWAGPYEIPAEDRSEEDARDVPFGSLRATTGGGGAETAPASEAKPAGRP